MDKQLTSRFATLLRTITITVLLAGIGAGSLAVQTTGTILGSVQDQSGAVLPGAAVLVTRVETGNVRTTVTGGRGEYRLPALPVGT